MEIEMEYYESHSLNARTHTHIFTLTHSFALIHLLISVHCSIIRLVGARAHVRVRARSFAQYYYICIYMRMSIYCRCDCAECARVRALSLVHSVFCDDLNYRIHQHISLVVVVVLTILLDACTVICCCCLNFYKMKKKNQMNYIFFHCIHLKCYESTSTETQIHNHVCNETVKIIVNNNFLVCLDLRSIP